MRTTLAPKTSPTLKVRDRTLSWAVGVSLTFGMLFGAFLLGDVRPAAAARHDVACTNTAGNGTTTGDWKIVQDKINGSAPGDEIVISGTCLLIKTIELADARTYRGDARNATILRQAAGRNLAALVSTDTWTKNQNWVNTGVRIERLTIDANSAQNTRTHGLVLKAWDSRVHDVEIHAAAGNGIHIDTLSANGTALASGQTMVNSIISDSYIHHNGGSGVRVNDPGNAATDWILERNWIEESGGSGIDLDNSAGWQIRNNHLYGVGVHAISAHRCFNTGINDNYVEDFGKQGTAAEWYFGIRCTLQEDVPNAITGNRVNLFTENGGPAPAGTHIYIGLDGVNGTGAAFATVTGNAAVGHGTAKDIGLGYYIGNGASLTVVSTGNLISGMGTPRDTEGSAKVHLSAGI
ncbi:right-handed parallel beta-helix repeat-containing protein [Phytomonospora sp. NPDC050363]|uniref:right-handed parallel beta-helix repeat-containing protein n=1 Tax=Phytomonospora sp. NPDC050363 TaxID=3155642 RepID=UPI0033EF797C